jgi:secretin/TonB-like protein
MRATIFVTLLALCTVMPARAAGTGSEVQLPTNIPAQDLGPALRTLAKERGFQIVYASQEVAGRQTPGAQGTFTNLEALQRLLAGTGMTYQLLDEQTVTVTLAAASPAEAVQRERPERRATAPALPEVAVSAERDELVALRAKMTKLEEEFFAQYNRLNTDDQFDIACHEEVSSDGRVPLRICRPAFVDELQGAANLVAPPVATVLAKSKDYEKNVLDLIQRYPQLRRVVREREALEAQYEALRARDSRGGKLHQSKRADDACTHEPAGTFMRMTFAMAGYALCTGLRVASDADQHGQDGSGDEPMPQVEINARRESLRHLRSEIVKLEEGFYAKYNELNTDDEYDIHCGRSVPTGSVLRQRECQPVFVNRATEAEAQAFLGGYPIQPASSLILRKWPDFEKTLVQAIQTHPELQKLAGEHAAAQKRYEVVRKLKFRGKIFVLD